MHIFFLFGFIFLWLYHEPSLISMVYLAIFFMVASLAQGKDMLVQSSDCPSANEGIWKHKGKMISHLTTTKPQENMHSNSRLLVCVCVHVSWHLQQPIHSKLNHDELWSNFVPFSCYNVSHFNVIVWHQHNDWCPPGKNTKYTVWKRVI